MADNNPHRGGPILAPGEIAGLVMTGVVGLSVLTLVAAYAKRIGGGRGRNAVGPGATDPGAQDAVRQLAAELDALRDEMAGLRREMDESQNRLDFTERLLAQAKERGLLNAPKER
jgi:hypothetical protein